MIAGRAPRVGLLELEAKSGGTASFNHTINWQFTGDLDYTVTGGPASACGELDSYRNGSWLYSPSWICTNGSGYAYMGPWSWSSTYADQTDDPVFIRWPDSTTTNSLTHIWDKTCPSVQITSTYGSPPSTYYGTATDQQWGACFDSGWTYVYSYFIDETASPNLYWSDYSGSYSQTSPWTVYGSVSGMPSCGVGWSTPSPAGTTHVPGHHYFWQTCISDGGCVTCNAINFTP